MKDSYNLSAAQNEYDRLYGSGCCFVPQPIQAPVVEAYRYQKRSTFAPGHENYPAMAVIKVLTS